MNPEPFVSRILDDEGLTGDLEGPQAEMLVAWLVRQAERIASQTDAEPAAWKQIGDLGRRARAISRFVALWNNPVDLAEAASQAEKERLPWPMPAGASPAEVLQKVLDKEES